MRWKKYTSITKAAESIPNGEITDPAHAIPDVYGKALHLYFSLEGAVKGKPDYAGEVSLWRGLLALLALQEHLSLPLSWEKVTMQKSSSNPFDSALRQPQESFKQLLFSEKDKLWDGVNFYVLKWKDRNGDEIDILLYSPVTLVYPVADWREIFANLRGVKWYNAAKGCFLPTQTVLNEHEREIVYYWLEEVKKHFNSYHANKVQATIATHLDQYMKDLGVTLSQQDKDLFSLTEIGGEDDGPSKLFYNLKQTVRAVSPLSGAGGKIPTNQLFSDQICYFRIEGNNPFEYCLHSGSYKIENRKNWYAFLPLHPALRVFCGKSRPIEKASMTWLEKSGSEFIHATLTVSGQKYERDYKVVREATVGLGVAAPYEFGVTDEKSMPLISVWPDTISESWGKYYIMLDGSKCRFGSLEVAEIPGQSSIHIGTNQYTIQTDYPPYAIPIIRKFRGYGDKMSVGVVIPNPVKPEMGSINRTATVAVDFGTCSTMVFAQIDGQVMEVNIGTDLPLLVTKCDMARERIMRDYFIPPADFSPVTRKAGNLFSVFRRSGPQRNEVEPILDGVIYQTNSSVDIVEDGKENGKDYLMSNLKWQVSSQKAYYLAFMKQLVLHVTALLREKGVTSINWKYALPESMPSGDRDDVENIWCEKLQMFLKEATGNINHTVINEPLTESEAASRYFLFQQRGPVHAGIGYLVVDIGGGSTDIALWQGTDQDAQMKWHTSVKVAGRKMFTRLIRQELSNLCAGMSNDNLERQVSLIEQVKEDDTKNTLTDILLSTKATDLLEHYRQNCREDPSGWGRRLYSKISKAVSILVFALGYQVGTLLRFDTFKIPDEEGAFVIAFCGRGAKILDWIKSVDQNENDSHDKYYRLKGIFLGGVEAAGNTAASQMKLEIVVGDNPKCEVAMGLLVERVSTASDSKIPVGVSMDTRKYIDGANRFAKMFARYFGGAPQPLDTNTIAGQIHGHRDIIDQIVNVFMEIIYETMES